MLHDFGSVGSRQKSPAVQAGSSLGEGRPSGSDRGIIACSPARQMSARAFRGCVLARELCPVPWGGTGDWREGLMASNVGSQNKGCSMTQLPPEPLVPNNTLITSMAEEVRECCRGIRRGDRRNGVDCRRGCRDPRYAGFDAVSFSSTPGPRHDAFVTGRAAHRPKKKPFCAVSSPAQLAQCLFIRRGGNISLFVIPVSSRFGEFIPRLGGEIPRFGALREFARKSLIWLADFAD